ncbi:hypothetical protein GGS26DRAFT_301798 [Hypomontagnella submonticulosa]|nr:hypothetical protein GGS26DRAFT_301798 [Hypomontagnella submonticulosa]
MGASASAHRQPENDSQPKNNSEPQNNSQPKNNMLRTDELLLKARKRMSKTTYKMVNKETGCYGVAVKETPGCRPNLAIHHTENCGCLDVRMVHIAKHANVTFKRKGIKRGRRDDLILAIKLRLPDVGIRIKIPKSTEPVDEEGAEGPPRKVVEETPSGQVLTEEWDTLKAWRTRKIWKDW